MHVTFIAQKLDIGLGLAICSNVFLDDGLVGYAIIKVL